MRCLDILIVDGVRTIVISHGRTYKTIHLIFRQYYHLVQEMDRIVIQVNLLHLMIHMRLISILVHMLVVEVIHPNQMYQILDLWRI